MGFERIRRTKLNYSTVGNLITKNEEISLKALGLYFKIMTLPEHWDFSVRGIIATVKEGKHTVYECLKELQKHGYCKVIQVREKGRILGTEYEFYHEPLTDLPCTENQDTVNQDAENQDATNRTQSIKEINQENKVNNLSSFYNNASPKKINSNDFQTPKTLTELELGGAAAAARIQPQLNQLKELGHDVDKWKKDWIAAHANTTEFDSLQHAENAFKKFCKEMAALSKQSKTQAKDDGKKPYYPHGNPAAKKPQINGGKKYTYPPGTFVDYSHLDKD